MVHCKVSRRAILLTGSTKYTIGRHLGSRYRVVTGAVNKKIKSNNKG